MGLEVGALLQGRITGITKYGVFVDIGGSTGMVHISEIANEYVREISDYVREGQEVSVKVLGVDERGRISLSMRQAADGTGGPGKSAGRQQGRRNGRGENIGRANAGKSDPGDSNTGSANAGSANAGTAGADEVFTEYAGAYPQEGVVRRSSGSKEFDDMLSRFMKTSDERISGMRRNGERRPRRGSRK